MAASAAGGLREVNHARLVCPRGTACAFCTVERLWPSSLQEVPDPGLRAVRGVVTPLGVRGLCPSTGRARVIAVGQRGRHAVAMTLASATTAPVPVRSISALLHLLTMSRRHLRTASVVLPPSMPIRFGKSYRWPDGSWTHCR